MLNAKKKEAIVVWEPQPGPQTFLITCPVFEVFFGGARGGGKTEASIGDWLSHSSMYGEYAIGLFVRRKFKQLAEVIARTKLIFPKLGAKYNEKNATWLMPNGARLKFAYLERDEDAAEYQGHNYTRIYVEEAGDFPSEAPIKKLKATLRSAMGVPVGMRLTGNPGGPGHNWIKARYINPNPKGFQVITDTEILEVGQERVEVSIDRVFIPSRVEHNQLLLRHDPGYVLRLKQSGSAALVKAWLKGDWDAVDGAFFNEFDEEKHVLDSSWIKEIPKKALRYRAFDWGSAKPFSTGWWAFSDGTWGLPPNALFKYREWYGASGDNKGLGMVVPDVAKGIRMRERGEMIRFGVADPAIFIKNGGPSIAETMSLNGCNWRRADNKRQPGWEQIRLRLRGINGVPLLYFSDECADSIRTLPVLQHDDKNAEDLNTEQEDHAADEIRYACMARPWHPTMEERQFINNQSNDYLNCSLNDIVQRLRRNRIQRENWE